MGEWQRQWFEETLEKASNDETVDLIFCKFYFLYYFVFLLYCIVLHCIELF